MDQTDQIASHQAQQQPSINPESQKEQKKHSQHAQEIASVAQQHESQKSQKFSQNASQSLSQTGSQMDYQIMQGLPKKQKKRYSNFLEALGIDVNVSKKKNQSDQIQMKQSPSSQTNLSKKFQNEVNPGTESEAEINIEERVKTRSAKLESEEQLILVQPKSESNKIEGQYNQISFDGPKLEKSQGQISKSSSFQNQIYNQKYNEEDIQRRFDVDFGGDLNQQIYPPQNIQVFGNAYILQNKDQKQFLDPQKYEIPKMEIQENYQEQNFDNRIGEINYRAEEVQIDGPSHRPLLSHQVQEIQIDGPSCQLQQFNQSQQIQIDRPSYYRQSDQTKDIQIDRPTYQLQQSAPVRQFQQGQIEIDKNYDECSNSKSVSDINYDLIRNIYTPVSQFKIPKQIVMTSQLGDGERLSGQFSQNQEFYNDLEELKHIMDQPQQDIEIDKVPQQNYIIQEVCQHQQSEKKDQNVNNIFSQPIQQTQYVQQNINQEFVLKNNGKINSNQFDSDKVNLEQQLPSFDTPFTNHKAYSQKNDKISSSVLNSKKNSGSMALRNSEITRSIQGNQKRKYSDTINRSIGLSSVNNKISSNKKSKENSQGSNKSFLQKNPFDLKESSSYLNLNQRIMEIQEHPQPQQSIRMTPNNNNCFSNRSQKSIQSKGSNRSNKFDFNELQLPQFDGLEMVRNENNQPRLQRKSRSSSNQNRSRNSRSASTCKKSYDDLSEIHMEKIPQKQAQQFQDKSIKRSVHYINNHPTLSIQQAQIQKMELEQQFATTFQRKQNGQGWQNQEIQIGGNSTEQIQKKNQTSSVQTNYINQLDKPQHQSDTFKQQISHQLSYHFQNQRKYGTQIFENKQIQVDTLSQTSSKKSSSSKKKRELLEMRQTQKKQKKQRMRLVASYEIVIENPTPIEERLEGVIGYCKQFVQNTHHKSIFERDQFRNMLQKHFEYFGFQLQPKNDLGQRMLHDGIFACSFISFVKGSRNSGMLQSLMFTQFEDDVGIKTNKDFFNKELKRVKQQRQMHYNNQFEKRLKQYEQKKAKQQVNRMQVTRSVIKQHKSKQVHDGKESIKESQQGIKFRKIQSPLSNNAIVNTEIRSESNISIAGSSQTMTLDGRNDFSDSPVRKMLISDLVPKQNNNLIVEQNRDFQKDAADFDNFITASMGIKQEKKTDIPKPSDKLKKRVTRKKQNKKTEVMPTVVAKIEQSDQSLQQTVSQIKPVTQQVYQSRQKQINSIEKNQKQKPEQNAQKPKQTKGILKNSRAVKDDQVNKDKRPTKSPSKGQHKTSKTKKQKTFKEEETEVSGSLEKNHQKKRNYQKKSKLHSDEKQEQNKSETKSPNANVSMGKNDNEKANQTKNVKFTNSTKGGVQSNLKRKNAKMNDESEQEFKGSKTQEVVPERRALRSRSKK